MARTLCYYRRSRSMTKRLRKCSNESAEKEQNQDDNEEGEKGDPEPENSDSVGNETVYNESQLLTPTIILDDMDILDCPTCYESLYTPIFQCKNGHVSCSSCCVRLKNLCSFCRLSTGYIRCRAIENIIDSSRISCKNFKFGCPQILRCVEKRSHEGKCIHSPVSCPYKCSGFIPRLEMGEHLKLEHQIPFDFFDYDVSFRVPVSHTAEHHFLINKLEGGIFFLHNTPTPATGNAFSISQFEPLCGNGEFCYDITATNDRNSSLKFTSSSMGALKMVDRPNMKLCLVIPMGFFAIPNMDFALDVRITRKFS